jgi:FkbM family methyltransferase
MASVNANNKSGQTIFRGTNMKKLLKKMVAGTSLEPLSRRVYGAFNRNPALAKPLEAVDKNLQYDIQTIEVMKRVLTEDSNCIDIGCHEGSILAEILRFSPKGTHFAFEPLPAMYQGLLKTFGEFENINLYDFALSDTEGVFSFQHVESNPGYSGFLKRRYDRPSEVVQEIRVRANRLDNLVPDNVPVRFIKVDVEGAELQVFRGAAETIRKNLPIIVFEHGLGAADYYGTAPEDVYDLLVSVCGLKLFLMGEWLEKNGGTPLDRQAFGKQFSSGSNYYFMAAPR